VGVSSVMGSPGKSWTKDCKTVVVVVVISVAEVIRVSVELCCI